MKKDSINFNLPKNIKQIGNIDEKFKIYMEDYVFSYLQQYSKEAKGEEAIAVLIGENYLIDGNDVLFINGAIKGEHTIIENGILKLTEESFEYIDNEINTYFKDKEIVGWFYSQPGFSDYINEEHINYHKNIFKNPHQVFFLSDYMENFCSFYKYEKNVFKEIKGFIIYYEKNDAMNEYILNNKPKSVSLEKEKFKEKDEKLMSIKRKKLPQKQKLKFLEEQKKISNIFGSLSAVLFLVCFIMGAGLIQNDDRISELEQKLLKLDKSYKYILSQVKDDNVKSVFAESNSQNLNDLKTTQIENSTINLKESTTEATTKVIKETITQTTSEIKSNEKTKYKTYEVKDGDSLEAISKKFYGNRSKIEEIMELNGINDPHKIYSGMILNIP